MRHRIQNPVSLTAGRWSFNRAKRIRTPVFWFKTKHTCLLYDSPIWMHLGLNQDLLGVNEPSRPLDYASKWTLWVLPPFLFLAKEKYYFHTQGPEGSIETCTQISSLQVRYVCYLHLRPQNCIKWQKSLNVEKF